MVFRRIDCWPPEPTRPTMRWRRSPSILETFEASGVRRDKGFDGSKKAFPGLRGALKTETTQGFGPLPVCHRPSFRSKTVTSARAAGVCRRLQQRFRARPRSPRSVFFKWTGPAGRRQRRILCRRGCRQHFGNGGATGAGQMRRKKRKKEASQMLGWTDREAEWRASASNRLSGEKLTGTAFCRLPNFLRGEA